MNITSSSARAARERRRFAGFVWCAVAIVAILVWMGRKEGGIVVAPGMLFGIPLAAFVTLISVFAWMLHTSNSGPRGDNPLPLLTGVLTLLPPAVIAYCFVPLDSTGHLWPVLGVFVFGTLIMISPMQDELRAAQKTRHMSRLPEFAEVGVTSSEPSFSPLKFRDRDSARVRDRAEAPTKRQTVPGGHPNGDRREEKSENRSATPLTKPLRKTTPDHRRESDRNDSFRPLQPEQAAPERSVTDVTSPVRPVRREESQPLTAGSTKARTQSSGLTLERMSDDYGGELIEGTAVVHFAAGQSRANVHVPFKPPLPGNPEVECEAIGDVDLRLKVAMSEPFGIRLEARRRDASQAMETEVGFAAVYSP